MPTDIKYYQMFGGEKVSGKMIWDKKKAKAYYF